jgi:hypothetical protein
MVMTRSPQVKVGKVGISVSELGRRLERYSSSPRVGSLVIHRVRLPVGEVRVKPLSHTSDGAAETTLTVTLRS